jgi:hypothetical protein
MLTISRCTGNVGDDQIRSSQGAIVSSAQHCATALDDGVAHLTLSVCLVYWKGMVGIRKALTISANSSNDTELQPIQACRLPG